MEYLIILAILQGVTEFLPISSSAHLAMFPALIRHDDHGLLIDIAVHFGSLGAVVLYHIRLLISMATALLTWGRSNHEHFVLAILTIIASIPLVIIGYLVSEYDIITIYLRHLIIIGSASIIFGILLAYADNKSAQRRMTTLTFSDALLIGLAQPLALIPGTSRSGICMTIGRMVGLSRRASVRFAMILSIPAILGASVKSASDIAITGNFAILTPALTAAALSFAVALATIAIMMQLIERIGMMPFVVYRVALGVVLILFAFVV